MQPEALSNLKTYPALQDAINSLTSPQLANITFDQVAAIKGGWDSNSKMAGPLLDMVNLAQATGSLPSAQFPSANNSRVGAVVLQVARSIATSPYASAEQRDYWAQQVVNANNQDPKNAPLTLDSVTQKNIDDYIKNVKFNFQTIRATMLFVSGSLASVPLYQSGGTANNLQATAYLLQFIGPAISGYSKYLNQYEVDMSGGLEQQGFNEVFNVLNLAATAYAISQNDSNTPSSTIATQALSSTSSIMFTISEFPQKSYFSVVDGQFVAKNFKILGYELQPPAWAGAAAANINALGQVIVATNVLVQSIVAYLDLPANTSINLKAAYISTIAFTAAELVALAVAMIYQPELAPMIATVAAFMPSFTGIVAAVDMKRASNDFADTGQSIMSDICEQIYQYLAVSSAPIVGPIGSIFGIPLMGDIVNRMTANNNAQIFMAVNEYEAWVSLNCHDALAAINVIRAGLIALAQSAASISASSQSYDFIAIHTVTFNAQDQYFGNNENLSYASVRDISSVNPASVDVVRTTTSTSNEVDIAYDMTSVQNNIDIVLSGQSNVRLVLTLTDFKDPTTGKAKANTIELTRANVTVYGNDATYLKLDITMLTGTAWGNLQLSFFGIYAVYLDDILQNGLIVFSLNLDVFGVNGALPFAVYGVYSANFSTSFITSSLAGVIYYADPRAQDSVILTGIGGNTVQIGGAGCVLKMNGTNNNAIVMMQQNGLSNLSMNPAAGYALGDYDGGSSSAYFGLDSNGVSVSRNVIDFTQSSGQDDLYFTSSGGYSFAYALAQNTSPPSANSASSVAIDGGQFINFQQLNTGPAKNYVDISSGTQLDCLGIFGEYTEANFNLDNYYDSANISSPQTFALEIYKGSSTINLNKSSNTNFAISFGAGALDQNLNAVINASASSSAGTIISTDYLNVGGKQTFNLYVDSKAALAFNGGNEDIINVLQPDLSNGGAGQIVIADAKNAVRSSDAQLMVNFLAYSPKSLYVALLENNALAFSRNGLAPDILIEPGSIEDEQNIIVTYFNDLTNTTCQASLDKIIQTVSSAIPVQQNSLNSYAFYNNSASHLIGAFS